MKQQEKLRGMIIAAFGAAIIGILAQVSIPLPFSPVPITGQTFAIGLIVTIFGMKWGTISVIVYALLGAVGVPVFSKGASGLGALLGPTGGYIIGFIPTALIIGYYLHKTGFTIVHAIIANLIGMVVTLAFGTVWLQFVAEISFAKAMALGTTPFIPLGIVKAIAAAWLGIVVRKRLMKEKLLPAYL